MNARHSLLLLVLLLPLLLHCGKEPLRIYVTFEDAGGLEEGAKVMHRGLEVGKVTSVGLDERGLVLVALEIDDEYRTAIASNSVVRIAASGLRRRRHVEISEGAGERRPLRDGEVLVGSEGPIEDWLENLKQAAVDMGERSAEWAAEMKTRLRDLAESDEAKEFLESVEQLGQEARRRTAEEWERFRTEELPAVLERGEEMARRLEEEGRTEEAEQLRRDLARWAEALGIEQPPEETEPGPPVVEAPPSPPGGRE